MGLTVTRARAELGLAQLQLVHSIPKNTEIDQDRLNTEYVFSKCYHQHHCDISHETNLIFIFYIVSISSTYNQKEHTSVIMHVVGDFQLMFVPFEIH